MPKNKATYKALPEWGDLEKMTEISADFLPRPEELVFRSPKLKKITIVLDEQSVDFFKHEASKFKTSYQRMIRTLLHEYAKRMTA